MTDKELDLMIKRLRETYPVGTRVELVSMEDEQAPPKGTKGEVFWVDDIGTIQIQWDNGSTLGVIPGVDKIRKIGQEK